MHHCMLYESTPFEARVPITDRIPRTVPTMHQILAVFSAFCWSSTEVLLLILRVYKTYNARDCTEKYRDDRPGYHAADRYRIDGLKLIGSVGIAISRRLLGLLAVLLLVIARLGLLAVLLLIISRLAGSGLTERRIVDGGSAVWTVIAVLRQCGSAVWTKSHSISSSKEF